MSKVTARPVMTFVRLFIAKVTIIEEDKGMLGVVCGMALPVILCLRMLLLPASAGAGHGTQLVGSPNDVCSLPAYVVDPDP